MANLPSGNGQTTAANSMSVVVASDVPSMNGAVWSVAFSTALVASQVISATACTLRSLTARLDATLASGTYYLQLFNTAAAPAEATGVGSMLIAPWKFQHTGGTDQTVEMDFGAAGISASTGATAVLSTTEFTKTISSAALSITAEYRV